MTARKGRLVVAALLVALVLSGCGGKKGETQVEVAPGHVITVEEPVKATHGIVAGLVGNDALYPLDDVFVVIMGLGLNGTTDDSGRFAIVNVPPGIYIVEGSKKDHKTVQTTVDVQPGGIAKAILLLERIPPTDPYHITWDQDAYVFYSGPIVASDRNVTLPFELDPSRPVTLVFESDWDGAVMQPLADRFLEFRLTTLDGKEVLRDTMANPFVLHVDAGVLPPGQVNFRFTSEPDPTQSATYDGQGRNFVTIFYNEAAPSDWSLLAGSV